MPTSRSARKQQSRLAFTPLPSSSPAAKDYHQQIRDRAAAVTLDSSPSSSKRRKTARHAEHDLDRITLDGPTDRHSAIPTPVASLERPVKPSKEPVSDFDSDDEPIVSTQQRKSRPRSRAQQQRLDFSSARDPESFDSPVRLPLTRAKSSGNSRNGIFSSQGQQALVDLSSDSEAELLVLKKRAPRKAVVDEEDGEEAPKPRKLVISDQEEEDEESDVITSTAIRRRQKRALQESEDEDGMPTTTGKQKRKPKRRGSHSSFIVDSPPAAVDSDDDVIVVERPSKKRRREASESENEEDEQGEAEARTPSRRRLKQRRVLSQQEKDDLAEDMGDLGASSDFEFNPVTSQSTQKSARQAALDRLRRKRTGQLPQVAEEDNEEVDEDGEDEEQEEAYGNEDEDEDEEAEVQVTSSRHIFKPDDNDEGFIVEEEEEGPLGVPDNGLPIEFTKYASMKPKELFKYAVEWMVQKKINPAFKSDDQLYDLTFRKLDDEVRGLAGSKFTSSAWRPEFTLALQARPEIAFEELDRTAAEHYLRDKCDACNRSQHPATWEIQFRGQPYHRDTLEDVANDDDEGEHENSDDSDAEEGDPADRPAWDAQDREIVPETHIFYVGQFCKANAETAHSLQHWRHALYDWVVTFLTGRGYFNADRLVEREKWNTKKRRKYANKIVDSMERDGEVKRLWRSFREQVDVARHAKEGGRYAPSSP